MDDEDDMTLILAAENFEKMTETSLQNNEQGSSSRNSESGSNLGEENQENTIGCKLLPAEVKSNETAQGISKVTRRNLLQQTSNMNKDKLRKLKLVKCHQNKVLHFLRLFSLCGVHACPFLNILLL